MIKWCDRVVIGSLGFLIFFTPLAFGSVHPWAFALMEATVFFLVIVWMIRLQSSEARGQRSDVSGQSSVVRSPWSVVRGLLIPLFLFFVFVLFQLLPLPPALLRLLSPSTFELYTRTLPGWPDGASYAELEPGKQQSAKSKAQSGRGQTSEITSNSQSEIPQSEIPPAPVLLPTPDEVNSGAPVPFEQGPESRGQGEQSAKSKAQRADGNSNPQSAIPQSEIPAPNTSRLTSHVFPATWLPLSLAPSRTGSDLLKLASYAALFFIVLLYPFAEGREQGAGSGGQRSQGEAGGKLISLWMKRKDKMGGRGQRSEVGGQRSEVRGQSSVVRGHFARRLLILVTVSGLIVAAIGFIQRFTWNGKILWFFMPYDWSGFAPEITEVRASGPFINPDHFANYLALILPLALGLVIYSRHIFSKESQLAAKIFFGLTAFVAFTSLLLTLSRSGWMSAILGIALLFWMFPRRAEQESRLHRATKEMLVRRGSLLAVAILLIVSLFFIGPGGREQVDSRLHETVTQETGIAGRVSLWLDTFKMIRDFPILGVGLGSWQDLFPRYRSAPWTPIFYREAHNDYVELLAETGVIGLVLLLLFFSLAAKRVSSYLRLSSDKAGSKALAAMPLAALGAMTFHEFFDFNLQIPANAFLFTLLLAIAVRIAATSGEQRVASNEESVPHAPRSMLYASRAWPLALCVLSAFLVAAAFRQEMTPYPYSLKMPETVAEANDMVLAHPALSTPHVYLLRLTDERSPVEWQLNQVRAALWLNPNDPFIRDQYARLLLGAGNQRQGLSEVSQSVFNAPYLFAHYYLSGRLLPWLSTEEKNAVESGFKKANALDFPDAMTNLATFYEATNRYAERGRLFEAAAGRAVEAARKADLFVEAGSSYVKAGDEGRAEMLLRKAAALAPEAPRSYQMLATMVYGPQKQVANISKTISDGIKNGAPAFDLYLASAEAAQKAGALDQSKKALSMAKEALRAESQEGQEPLQPYYALAETAQRLGFPDEATSALLQALEFRPSSTETLLRLANFYLQDGNFDRAAYYFRSYVEINPAAADAFYHLALAEERQYRFAAAEDAYKRAVELAPQHDAYRQGYEALRARVAQNRKSDG